MVTGFVIRFHFFRGTNGAPSGFVIRFHFFRGTNGRAIED